MVLGSQGVGKTSLVQRYCKGSFNPSETTSTVGASFLTKRVVDSDTDTVVRLQIWDTGTRNKSLTFFVAFTSHLTFSYHGLTFIFTHHSRPRTIPLHLPSLLPRRQRLHPLLQHNRRPVLR